MTQPPVYRSPFSWRYASAEMRELWSEEHRRRVWRQVWVALAQVQQGFGLVTAEQVADLQAQQNNINLPRALQLEEELQHDLMAEVHTYAEQAPIGGSIIHLGATSMDIEDNAEALRLAAALDLTLQASARLLLTLAGLLEKYATLPVIAFTHLQPAEPTTLGYRLAQTAQDLYSDHSQLLQVRQGLMGKGFKGAVGTSASYAELYGADRLDQFEQQMSEKLGLPFFPIATQTYPRKQDYTILCALAGMAQTLYKFGFDLRILQSPPIGELAEPFGSRQIGSSAMPFKRNPIRAEKLDSLGRYIAQLPRIAWDNAAHSLLERTLDDSANRRTILPEAFLALDEMLRTAQAIVAGLRVNEAAIAKNLATYGPFAATERVLMAAAKKGGDRQALHECIRQASMQAWEDIQAGQPNPLANLLAADSLISRYLSPTEVSALMNADSHIGNAPQKTLALASQIRATLGQ